MTKDEVLSSLCYYDPRNPDYDAENGEKVKDCACDNCFYGRTKLAEHILEYTVPEGKGLFHEIEKAYAKEPPEKMTLEYVKKILGYTDKPVAPHDEELHKCINSPYYFMTKYMLVDGKRFTTAMDEDTFNKCFGK